MSKKTPGCIRLRGVRQNNLKNIDLDVPLGQLVVISGLSGSGKSSLAFDTLFAEGQRRYIETFSPYARQFLDRMDKPQARRIEGIPPAIAIEQRNSVKSTRSTVGTMTEITDYTKVFWAQLARLHCRGCGKVVSQETPQSIWPALRALAGEAEAWVTFTLDLSEKFSLEESLALVGRQGYRRLLVDGEALGLDESLARLKSSPPARLTVVQDRVKLKESNRGRFAEACEAAYHFGKGKLAAHWRAEEGGILRNATLFQPPALRGVRPGVSGAFAGVVQFQSSGWGVPGVQGIWAGDSDRLQRGHSRPGQDSGGRGGQTVANQNGRGVPGGHDEVRPPAAGAGGGGLPGFARQISGMGH